MSSRQQELDRYAARHHWERGPLRSYRAYGFTIGVGTEWPKQKFWASRGGERQAFDTLDELQAFVMARPAKVENTPD